MAPKDKLLKHQTIKRSNRRKRKYYGKARPSLYCITDRQLTFYQWLEKAGVKGSTEVLIKAAQKQALSTRSIETRIPHHIGL